MSRCVCHRLPPIAEGLSDSSISVSSALLRTALRLECCASHCADLDGAGFQSHGVLLPFYDAPTPHASRPERT